MTNGGERAFSLNVSISGEGARDFLRSLAYDETFYKRFEEDPKSVLEGIDGVDLKLPAEPLLPGDVKPPTREQLQAFVETGYVPPHANPPPYNGGCLVWSILYGVASQTEYEETSAPS